MAAAYEGMTVNGPKGQIGTVVGVLCEAVGVSTERVLARLDDGQLLLLQTDTYRVDDGAVVLASMPTGLETRRSETSTASITSSATRDLGVNEQTVIPVVREEVRVDKRQVDRGGVRVDKRIEEREEVVQQPVFREEVEVERVAFGRPIDSVPETREEGDVLIIPVVEELLVVEKRLVLREEIRITKRRIEETEETRVMVRTEVVDVVTIDSAGNVVGVRDTTQRDETDTSSAGATTTPLSDDGTNAG